MRFASQLMCFPVGASCQSKTPAGRHTDAMGDGKVLGGAGCCRSAHPKGASLGGQTPSWGHLRARNRAGRSGRAGACTGKLSQKIRGRHGDESPEL